MTSVLRVGIIGAGYIASWHADAIRATPDAQLVAVCDPASDAAEALASGYGIRAFTDLDDMIAAEICDVVHILTPPNLHRDIAVKCLGAGLHVMVEKPVALSVAEIEDMALAAETAFTTVAAIAALATVAETDDVVLNQRRDGDFGATGIAEVGVDEDTEAPTASTAGMGRSRVA